MKEHIQNDFPIFRDQANHTPLVFLDSAAAAQVPEHVTNAMIEYYRSYKANVHSGIYEIGERAIRAYEKSRETVAQFLGALSDEIIFTSGTTASINMLSRMLERDIREGDEIVVSQMEHHSNFIPWQELAKRTGAVFVVLPLEKNGTLSLETVRRTITKRAKIVAVTHVSHAIGAVNDIREICRIAHAAGALCVVDAAQSVPHMPVDVRAIACDFLAFSGQKLLGPTGTGVLYGRKSLLEHVEPCIYGGGMIREVHLETSSWANTPAKFEAGTPHIAGVIGLGAAIEYIGTVGSREEIETHDRLLGQAARRALSEVPGVTLYGSSCAEEMSGIVSFTVDGIHPHDVAEVLSRHAIAVRAGHHCAMPLMKHLGVLGTVRASFYIYNSEDDIAKLVQGVKNVLRVFRK